MSNDQSYGNPLRNATAVNILRSWLRALDIVHEDGFKDGCDLLVLCQDAGIIQVQVLMEGGCKVAGDQVSVPAKAFTGKRKEDALEAFYVVLDAAGYERREPVRRGGDGPTNENGNLRKLHYKDEDFLVSIRHSEFRRSPNPADDRWKKYETAMTKVVWKFHQAEGIGEMCARMSVDIKDLMQIARCLMVNFCARYETEIRVENYNEGRFYRYLRQRFFGDIKHLLERKERSLIPHGEAVRIALGVEGEISPDPTDAYIMAIDHVLGLDEARQALDSEQAEEVIFSSEDDARYVKRNRQLDLTSSAALLEKLLGALPHDRMMEALTKASENLDLDYITRKEALRRIREHHAECETCQASGEIGAQEEQESAGFDSAGADE